MPLGTANTKEPKAVTKKTDAKTKKPKPQKAAKPTSKPSGLSEEKVVDSESEGPAPSPKPAAKQKNQQKEKVTKERTEKEQVARVKTAKEETRSTKIKAPLKPPTRPANASASSTSSGDDDTSSDESTTPVLKKPDTVSAQVNGVKRKADESSSEEETSDDESEQPAKKPKIGSDVETTDSSSSAEEEESEDEDSNESRPQPVTAKTPKSQAAAPRSLRSIPAPPYDPPEGYSAVKVSEPVASSMLSRKMLSGKQIWLISAPSGVPLASIKEVAMRGVQDGSTVLKHKGVDYALAEDKDRNVNFQSLLIPGQEGYQKVDAKVERALKLHRKVELPNLSKLQSDSLTGSNAAGDVARAAVSTIRPQPKGLKMRYKPPAFGPGDPGLGSESDSERQTTSGAMQFPKALGVHGASDKLEEAGKKREKKKRKTEDIPMVNGDMIPPLSATPAKRKKKDKVDETPARPATSVSMDSAGSEPKESKEERRMRKKLKREGRQKTEVK